MTTDQEVDEFLEHFGVKGMKWGIRTERRANRFVKVGKGQGTLGEKARSYTDLGPIDLIAGRGFRGGAARKGKRIKTANRNFKNDEATFRNVLTKVANVRYQDVVPTNKDSTNTKAAIGASIAGVILVNQGFAYLQRRAARELG